MVKFITEWLPLLTFFAVYQMHGLLPATAALIGVTAIAVIVGIIWEKKIPMVPLISAIILGIFGGLTLLTKDDQFIKMKPTIVSGLFALAIWVGTVMDRNVLKYMMGKHMQMSDHAWKIFSYRWSAFFLITAIANEVVWRIYPTDIWVQFKVFGLTGLTLVFTLAHIPFMKKHAQGINQ